MCENFSLRGFVVFLSRSFFRRRVTFTKEGRVFLAGSEKFLKGNPFEPWWVGGENFFTSVHLSVILLTSEVTRLQN